MQPSIHSARLVKPLMVGEYLAELLDDVVSDGLTEYAFILAVYSPSSFEPVLFVTSEKNQLADEQPGSGSHFLCAFPPGFRSHCNYAGNDSWSDIDAFEAKAIEVAKSLLKEHVEKEGEAE